jgi:hypothetical protein
MLGVSFGDIIGSDDRAQGRTMAARRKRVQITSGIVEFTRFWRAAARLFVEKLRDPSLGSVHWATDTTSDQPTTAPNEITIYTMNTYHDYREEDARVNLTTNSAF